MNKKLMAVSFAAVTVFAASAHAAGNGYLAVGIGASMPLEADVDDGTTSSEVDMDTGHLFSLAIGAEVQKGFRLEGEYAYRAADVDETGVNADVSVHAGMLNGIFDIATSSGMSPYIGAGIGAANMNWDGNMSDDNETVFAYQLMAGLNFEMNPETTLRLGYRYFDPSVADIGALKIDNSFHELEVGLRFNF